MGSGLRSGQGLGSSSQPPEPVSLFTKCVGTYLVLPHPRGWGKVPRKGHEQPTEPLLSGRPGVGLGGVGCWRRAGGLAGGACGVERDGRILPGGRPGWRGTRGQARRAVRAAAERAARRPWGSHEQRRGDPPQPARGRPAAAARRSPLPHALTMSICCCFFFRDYGSSKRKSGKGDSGRLPLRPPLPPRARSSPTLRPCQVLS